MTIRARLEHDPSSAIGLAICGALDIDPDHVVSLVLAITVGEAPRLTVEHVSIDETAWDLAGDLGHVLIQYELKKINP